MIRRRRKAIEFIKDEHGSWLSSRSLVGDHIINFFHSLFESYNPSILDDLEGLITPLISMEENIELCSISTLEEIRVAVWCIGSLKSPGPDGMTGLFYKHYWDIVGADMVEMVQDFFHHGYMLKALNHSFITMIPKSDHSSKIGHYRPISLCNVAYKIISKILANWLKH